MNFYALSTCDRPTDITESKNNKTPVSQSFLQTASTLECESAVKVKGGLGGVILREVHLACFRRQCLEDNSRSIDKESGVS